MGLEVIERRNMGNGVELDWDTDSLGFDKVQVEFGSGVGGYWCYNVMRSWIVGYWKGY